MLTNCVTICAHRYRYRLVLLDYCTIKIEWYPIRGGKWSDGTSYWCRTNTKKIKIVSCYMNAYLLYRLSISFAAWIFSSYLHLSISFYFFNDVTCASGAIHTKMLHSRSMLTLWSNDKHRAYTTKRKKKCMRKKCSLFHVFECAECASAVSTNTQHMHKFFQSIKCTRYFCSKKYKVKNGFWNEWGQPMQCRCVASIYDRCCIAPTRRDRKKRKNAKKELRLNFSLVFT